MKRVLYLPFLLFAISFLISCNSQNNEYHLTQKEAEYRASLLSNIHYNLKINLSTEDFFEGNVEISFDVWKSEKLRLDYFQGEVQSVVLNEEHQLDNIDHTNGFLIIPAQDIKKGNNKIKINFKTPYARTGNGLHKFTDPDDKEIYIYSQFEAFHANKMFPCFDQPDLKATFQLTVEAPKSWKVISSNNQSSILLSTNNPNSIHTFPKTEKFSSYVFSLHAGPYQVFEDSYNSIPLKLYVRRSLAKYINPRDWFQFTKEGFAFYEGYFDFAYPFSKYDQIIVPEFNFGAMENVGAVTFSERFVSRGPMTRAQRENLSDVILHELAHMWFGNLVTMKWWNGLWLNESFATYMASLAQERNSEFHETWETFFEKMKQWAYDEDSFSTNHPIEAKVENTEEAFTQFDGITYGKGASVLKQLVFFIGETNFQNGVRTYLKRYAYSNSTLKDFLFELELASGISLRKWSKDWLETKGTNEIEFVSECSDRFLKWKVIQSKPGMENKFRDHKINIGIYKFDANQKNDSLPALVYDSFPIIYTGRATSYVQEVKDCPDFILVNAEDQDFVTWKWKDVDLEKVKYILKYDTNSFRKLMLWNALAQQIELGEITFEDFYKTATEIIPGEESSKLKKWILANLSSDRGYSYFTSRFWFPNEKRDIDIKKLSTFLWEGLSQEKPQTDLQKYWFSAFLDSTFLKEDQERLWNLFIGKTNIIGLKLDQDQRWSILIKLSSLGYKSDEFRTSIETEKKIDTSSRGTNSALSVEATSPSIEIKTKWFKELVNPKSSSHSTATLRSVAYQLFPVYQKELQLPFFKLYLEALDKFDKIDDENYLDGFAKSLTPDFCSAESKHLLSKFVNSHSKLPASIKKTLKKQIDLEERCILMKKKNLSLK
ncbi:aminopeptidase N [Leptospira ognonensis]|uniref:Aminopeptidase N n=1 Tax=Leptospira ognonensis TaxID=2484945 RepID=A0A4R9KAP0_9LEPT|nr:aminopeptidase N [Leptospira ognonensis]TGL63106.1 aminopeptidase N [Leptospira ognonensis]